MDWCAFLEAMEEAMVQQNAGQEGEWIGRSTETTTTGPSMKYELKMGNNASSSIASPALSSLHYVGSSFPSPHAYSILVKRLIFLRYDSAALLRQGHQPSLPLPFSCRPGMGSMLET